MERRSYALITGLFLVVLIGAGAAAGVWLSRSTTEQVPYLVVSQYPVSGLQAQAGVTYRGVAVGSVESIRFDRQHPDRVLIRIKLQPDVPITRSTYAKLRERGVTGLSEIELSSSGKGPGQPLPTSEAHPGRIPMHPSLLSEVSSRGEKLLDKLNTLTDHLNRILSRDNQQRINRILQNLQTATGDLHQVLSRKNQQRIDSVLQNLQTATGDLVRLQQKAAPAVERLPGLESHANRTLSNLDNLLQGKLEQQTLPRLDTTLDQLSRSARSVRQLSESLRHQPGSLLRGSNLPPPGPGEPGYHGGKNQ
ncbi:MAG TPA: MlaD family protein [Gammaproteobacteria bacterium]|nr:MlaD family protein [Gammaproteobacteria bacterium]